MTLPSSPERNSSLGVGALLSHEALLRQTDWVSLEQPFPDKNAVAEALEKLLDNDPAVGTRALRDLREAANHQNTLYAVTTSVARYVAAVLPDPRTEAIGDYRRGRPPGPLRAALLDWLGDMADDASDAAVAGARSLGFEMSAAQAEFRAARPALFAAVSQYVDDGDDRVRHAAVVAALLLLDSIEERERHRVEFAPRLAELLKTSGVGFHRERALDSLDIWGEDTGDLWRAEWDTALESAYKPLANIIPPSREVHPDGPPF